MAFTFNRPQYGAGSVIMDQARFDEGLRAHMLRVYNYLGAGLLVSAIAAFITMNSPLMELLFTRQQTAAGAVNAPTGLGLLVMFAPLVMLLGMGFMMQRLTAQGLQSFYWGYTVLQGIGLAALLDVFTGISIANAFLMTAVAFGALSAYGYSTKRNLSGIGSFMVMMMVGLLVLSLLNMFFIESSGLAWLVSIGFLLAVSVMTAFETQNQKQMYAAHWGDEANHKLAIFGAIGLYTNFIVMFQFLLQFLGNRE